MESLLSRRQGFRLARIAAAMAASLAVLRICADAFGWNITGESFAPLILPLKVNFALGELALAGAIWLASGEEQGSRRTMLFRCLTMFAAIIGGLTLTEESLGISLGIDDLAWKDNFPLLNRKHSGQMTFTAALSLLFLSLGLFLLSVRRGVKLGQCLAAATFGLNYFNIVANLYGVAHIYGAALYLTMSVPASLVFVLLSVGLCLLRTDSGLMGLIISPKPGGVMVRKLLPAALLTPTILGWLRLQGELLGLYDGRFGLALFATSSVGVLSLLMLHVARELDRVDENRVGAENKFDEGEMRYRTVVESLPQLVWTCLSSGECDYLSKRWLDYTGAPEKEQLGSGWLDFVHPEDTAAILTKWTESAKSGTPLNGEYRVRDHEGQYRWFQAQAIPLRDMEGKITKWFGSSTNIEDLKLAEAQVLELNATLEQRVAERTAELVETRTRLQAVLDSATQVSIIACDLDGTIQIFNAGAEAMLGYTAEEVVGRVTPMLIHDRDEVAERSQELSRIHGCEISGFETFIHSAKADVPESRHWTYIRKDGSRVPVQLAVSAIHEARNMGEGRITGYLGMALDLSTRISLECQLLEQNESLIVANLEAESASLAKSEFLANMSHEIRTPMNGIIGMTGLLLDTDLSSDQEVFCDNIRSSSEALLALINDILDFSKIEAGKMELELIEFSLRPLLDAAIQLLAPKAEDKGLELTCHLDQDLEGSFIGDPGRIRQILLNLAGNAIKFTSSGEVAVRVERSPRNPASIQFSIRDTGIGISEERQKQLFQPFTQVDASITRKFGGSGLGLAICKDLVKLMDGEIGIDSAVGQGSKFWFEIPLTRAEGMSRLAEIRPGKLEGEKILIVDDSETNRLLLKNLLLGWGCLYDVATGVESALTKLRAAARNGKPFRVALIDYRMPELNGDDLGRLIKADPECRETLLVLMSSLTHRGQARRSAAAGFVAFLTKPIRQDDLRDALEQVIGRQSGGEVTGQPLTLITQHSIAESRQRRGRILLAEDNRTNQLVAVAMVKKLGYWIEVAANGGEVLEALRSAPYDLVLMDCQMPEMDGFTATQRIRSGEANVPNRGIPIIAITAHAMKGDREKCLAAGMNDYVSKPIVAAELTVALERWMPSADLVS